MRPSLLLRLSLAVTALLAPSPTRAQVDTAAWKLAGTVARFTTYKGRRAIELRDAVAWMPGSSFENGTIELDISVSDSVGFPGIQFRMKDAANYEHYYLRPIQSGNPDATQYEPVYRGNTGWQIYVGDAYTAPLRFRYDTWMHLKLVVSGTRAAVYLDSAQPVQYLPRLIGPRGAGLVAIGASGATTRFANVRLRPAADGPLEGRPIPEIAAPPGTLTSWSVSAALEEKSIAARDRVTDRDVAGLTWTPATPTERGIINLGRLADRSTERNTVIAGLTLTSDAARTVRVKFGFSDRVRVFLNGRLIYAGDDGYRTRDYRFLGTVGLFDEVALPLDAGANTLWFAVSESFGGWAVTAAMDAVQGVTVSAGCGALTCQR